MKKHKFFIFGLILSLIPLVVGGIFYKQLPDTLATHFNFQGKADGYSDKNMALFMLPLGLTVGYIAMYFFTIKDPKHKNHNETLNRFVFLLLPVMNIATNAFIIAKGLGKDINVSLFVTAFVGLIFVIVGNFLPKVKRNYTVGIQLPWTLHSDVVWEKTHRMAGYLWILGGVIVILSSFLLPSAWLNYCILTSVGIMTVIPAIYSYVIYKKEEGGKLS